MSVISPGGPEADEMCALLRLSPQSILYSNSQMGEEMSGGNLGTQFSSHFTYPPFSRYTFLFLSSLNRDSTHSNEPALKCLFILHQSVSKWVRHPTQQNKYKQQTPSTSSLNPYSKYLCIILNSFLFFLFLVLHL